MFILWLSKTVFIMIDDLALSTVRQHLAITIHNSYIDSLFEETIVPKYLWSDLSLGFVIFVGLIFVTSTSFLTARSAAWFFFTFSFVGRLIRRTR
jgi:hypothetical protein